MKVIGVITGDIVQSTKIDTGKGRATLLGAIKKTVEDIRLINNSVVKLEIYRGDSFQVIVGNPIEALRVAILIRLGLRATSASGSKWDSRLALGLGTDEFAVESIGESDGQAYRYSGWCFDQLNKDKRLSIRTPWAEIDDELYISTAFADAQITTWTVAQAQILYYYLLWGCSQKELADRLNKSPQLVNSHIINGKYYLIELYMQRYEDLIKNKVNL